MSWQIHQHINFYTDEFRPPSLPQDIRRLLVQMGVAAGVAVLAVVLLLMAEQWSGYELQQGRQQQLSLQQQIATEQLRYPPLVLDPQLQKQLSSARSTLQNSQRVLTYLSQENIGERISLTPLVAQLGDVQSDGIWLSGFSLFNRGEQVELRGYAQQAAQISPYIAALAEQPAYAGKAFRQVDLQQADGQPYLIFRLDSRQAGAADARAVAAGGQR